MMQTNDIKPLICLILKNNYVKSYFVVWEKVLIPRELKITVYISEILTNDKWMLLYGTSAAGLPGPLVW